MKRIWELTPVLQIVQKNHLTKFCYLMLLMRCGSKDIFKNAPCLMYWYSSRRHWLGKCGIIENRKTWISWEGNITLLQNTNTPVSAKPSIISSLHNICNDPEVNKDAELLDNLQNIFKDNEASLMLKPHLSKVKSAFYEDCVKKNNHQN